MAEMTDFDEAMEVLNGVKEINEVESVKLLDSLGRVNAEDIISNENFPPFNRSAMDGFAFRIDDLKKMKEPIFKVKNIVLAGHPEKVDLEIGECVRIMTGGKVPEPCDTVIEFEKCEEKDGKIKLLKIPRRFYNIALKGEDLKKGEVALKKGARITPKVVNLLASLGMKNVKVKRKIKIGIISTGDELIDIDEERTEGKIRNSSKYALFSQIKEIHQEHEDLGTVEDDEKAIREALKKGLERDDIILITGGSSAGDKDLTLKVLNGLNAEVLVKKMAIKPGRPTILATIEENGKKKWIFGMPGNPVSTYNVFNLFVKKTIEKMLGTSGITPMILEGVMEFDFKKKKDRLHFIPCKVKADEGAIRIEYLKYNGSGDFTSLSKADGFFLAPKDVEHIQKGEKVKFFFIS
ncbi:gephyrin-like molybdotransferase Glp [Mesoaciditoga lauensis]|uniref:molybdopterin molybdotransferase MoeA n=1 Tax=Mesoaciditoga lauensis TaxID=1495039 RepID=UPI00056586A0|nr:gephyrin-like molybdotransferase Glp [Mesoaciditoga lauensis]